MFHVMLFDRLSLDEDMTVGFLHSFFFHVMLFERLSLDVEVTVGLCPSYYVQCYVI